MSKNDKMLPYRGYQGNVVYSEEDRCLFGKVIGIKSLLSYEGGSVQELEQDFKNVIPDFVAISAAVIRRSL